MNNKLKLKLKYIALFILIIICAFAINLTDSRYSSSKTIDDSIQIAKPIVEMESTSATTIENILPGQTVEYEFNIKNTDGTFTNEVLMNYYIKVTYNNNNLPLTYEIFDVTDGTEKKLTTTSNQTDIKSIGYSDVEVHKYRIKFTWPSNENDVSYAGKQISFDIDVYAEQAVE